MMKTRCFMASAMMLACTFLQAQDRPLWLRNSAISPDGKTIAFCYKGDIFTVPTEGGRAFQVTTNSAYDTHPVWSPDGKRIAFASDRNEGDMDVYIVDRDGGAPLRLTRNSANEYPTTFKDNDHLLYTAYYMPTASDAQFPSPLYTQVYEIGTKEENLRPTRFSEVTMENISWAGNQLLYQDVKGVENDFRKHHTSSVTRDIWLCSPIEGKREYKKLTSFKGEDREPVWATPHQSFYFLSEKSGSFNVYKMNVDGTQLQQLTHFTKHPVRSLSAANGIICFSYDGELYTMKEGSEPQKVKVAIKADLNDKELYKQVQSYGANEFSVSPNGKEVAFILHGDVYTTSIEYKTTKRITDTPEQERNVSFSPDGRSLVYAAERNGVWQIYQASLVNKEDKTFTYANEIKEERLTHSNITSFQPAYSPNGKEIAFLENRTTIKVLNLKSKKIRTVLEGKYEYSYIDGDQSFEWSPDSKWLLTGFIGNGGWHHHDIAVVNASGNGEIHNITQSGYSDNNAKWVLGGKAIVFQSDRAGYRSHGSWGAENDAYIIFLDLDTYEKFLMNKEDLALLEEQEKEKKVAEEKSKSDKKKKKEEKKNSDKADEAKDSLQLDFVHASERIVRLTVNSSHMGDYFLNPKGDKFYYTSISQGSADLWMHDLKDNSTKIVLKGIGASSLEPNKKGDKLYLFSGGSITEISLPGMARKVISFEAPFNYRPYAERQYMFNHVWQQVKDKFYVPNLHGVDWEGYKKAYEKFLPYINNSRDFSELLSEMLGELNASHTGASYRSNGSSKSTADLGLFFDESYEGNGLRVQEIIDRGPFARKNNKVQPGSVITAIDNEPIVKGKDYFALLENKAGKKVRITFTTPGKKQENDVIIRPLSKGQALELLYLRWRDNNDKKVDSLSQGKVAYVHVRGMDSESFRHVYSKILGAKDRDKKAVIVDTRHNGGGWLHDDLATFLSGKKYVEFAPRGQYIGHEPINKWIGPSCVLIGEDNYSDASGFPFTYRALGLGKLIGAPVPGTMTAVWWESLINPRIIFGIPQVGCRTLDGKYLENVEIEPDILIYNAPQRLIEGEDQQLEGAVQEMLKETKSK